MGIHEVGVPLALFVRCQRELRRRRRATMPSGPQDVASMDFSGRIRTLFTKQQLLAPSRRGKWLSSGAWEASQSQDRAGDCRGKVGAVALRSSHYSRRLTDQPQPVFLAVTASPLRRTRGFRTGTHGTGHFKSRRRPVRIALAFPVLPQAENVVAVSGECLHPITRIAHGDRSDRANDGHQVLVSPLVPSDQRPKHDDALVQSGIVLMSRRIVHHGFPNHAPLGWITQAVRRLTVMPFPPSFLKIAHPREMALLDSQDREFPILRIRIECDGCQMGELMGLRMRHSLHPFAKSLNYLAHECNHCGHLPRVKRRCWNWPSGNGTFQRHDPVCTGNRTALTVIKSSEPGERLEHVMEFMSRDLTKYVVEGTLSKSLLELTVLCPLMFRIFRDGPESDIPQPCLNHESGQIEIIIFPLTNG